MYKKMKYILVFNLSNQLDLVYSEYICINICLHCLFPKNTQAIQCQLTETEPYQSWENNGFMLPHVKIENFAYSAGLICHICVLNKRLGYHIIFYKKIKGNPSTCGRATVLSVEKEKQIILPSVQISQ